MKPIYKGAGAVIYGLKPACGEDQHDKWACVDLIETIENSHVSKMKDLYKFLDEQALHDILKDDDLVKMHIANCKSMCTLRADPQFPNIQKKIQYWTLVETSGVESDATAHSTQAKAKVGLSKASAKAVLAPGGPLGALPSASGIHPKAQSALWNPRFHNGAGSPGLFGTPLCNAGPPPAPLGQASIAEAAEVVQPKPKKSGADVPKPKPKPKPKQKANILVEVAPMSQDTVLATVSNWTRRSNRTPPPPLIQIRIRIRAAAAAATTSAHHVCR